MLGSTDARVVLIGTDGTRISESVSLADALAGPALDRRTHDAVLVAHPHGALPVVRIVARATTIDRERAAAAAASLERRRCREKTLVFGSAMHDHDLGVRYARVRALLDGAYRVRLVVEPRGATRRVPAAREGMLRALMERLAGDYGRRVVVLAPPAHTPTGAMAALVQLTSDGRADQPADAEPEIDSDAPSKSGA